MKHHPPDGATSRARRLRSDPTEAEKRMWRMLRENFLEMRFRRQAPIRHYIVDFASHRARLVIEVDGGQHSVEADAQRTAAIEAEGYRLLRFWNNEVLGNPDGVLAAIASALPQPHPHPTLPHRGGGLHVSAFPHDGNPT
jgi:very-short-patch-repair endonuclease